MADDRRSVGVRVRPNSHDFIRQLRQDLRTKTATFYVDVKARTAPATRDVRNWANTDLQQIKASIPINANTGRATADMAAWRRRQAGIQTTIKVNADTSAAVREIEAVRAMARDITIKVKADTSRVREGVSRGVRTTNKTADSGGMLDLAAERRAADRFAKNVDQFMRQHSFSGVGDSLTKEISAALNKNLKGKQAKIDVDTSPARKSMRELLDKFSTEDIEIEVDADTSKATARTEELKRNLELRNVKLEADINLRKVRTELAALRLKEKLKKLEVDVQVKKGASEKIFDTLGDMEKRFGNLTVLRSLDLGPITLGKPTGLVGTLTTITALAGLIPGLVTGVSALSDAFVRLSGAASLAPGAIGALLASLATLSIGTQGVGDAFGAMFDMWNEGASDQISSANSLVSAQNNYRNAVVDEGKAQRDVARARREALGDLRDLNNELRGGVLNEAQSLLDLQKARDRYAQGGFDNETDRLQALLDIKKAELNVDTTREGNIKTQQKVNDANAQGVEGSDKVTDALEQQTRAAQATSSALAALTEAQRNGGGATQAFNDMLAQLSPNARDFVTTIAGMKDEMFGFRNALQDIIFQGAGPAFQQMFDNLMPIIGPGMEQIAHGLNDNLLKVFDTLQTPDGKSIIERILGGTAETQRAITQLIDPLTRGLGTLVAAGTEHLPQLVDLFTRLADRFADFIEEADKNGSLDKFMDDGIAALSNLADLGINLIKIINDLSNAFGGDLLQDLVNATDKLHTFLSSAEGQAKINEMMDRAKQIWEDWKPALEKLPGIFDSMSQAALGLINTIGPFLAQFTKFMEENPGLVKAFITGWLGAKVLTGVFGPIITLLTAAKTLGGTVVSLLEKLPGGANAVAQAMSKIPGVTPAGAGAGLTALGVAGGAAYIGYQGYQGYQAAGDAGATGLGKLAGGANQIAAGIIPGASDIGLDTTSNPGRFNSAKDNIDAALDWINQGADDEDKKKRAAWVKANLPGMTNGFKAPDSYSGGGYSGYTPWGARQGKVIEAHGGEYVQPKPVVDHYGVGAMKAVHEKRAVILGSYEEGGLVYDPQTGQYVATGVQHGLGGGAAPGPGIINTLGAGVASGINQVGQVASQVSSPYANTTADAAVSPFGVTGALPGPAGATGTTDTTGSFQNSFLTGLGIPGVGDPNATDPNSGPGWGPEGAPIGLGGGPDGFDIRKFGIGPGPVGSGPNDWQKFAGKTLGNFGSSFVTTLFGGILGGLGLGGLMDNEAVQGALKIGGHFADANSTKSQGAGAGQTNADVNSLLQTYGAMPANPSYPGYTAMPNVVGADGSAIGTYGVGTGANSGGYGNDKGQTFPSWVYQLGDAFGLKPSTYSGHQETDRNEAGYAPNPQHLNRGIDWSGPPEKMQAFADYLKQVPGLEQVIWNGAGIGTGDTVEIAGGRPQPGYFAGDLAGHGNHVHTRQNQPIPLPMVLPTGQVVPGIMPGGLPGMPGALGDIGTQNYLSPAPMGGFIQSTTPASGKGTSWFGNIPNAAAGAGPMVYPALGLGGQQPGTNPLLTGFPGAGMPFAGQSGSGSAQGFDKDGIKAVARQMYMAEGLPPNEWNDFDWLVNKESSWNPKARNASDHFGLIQFSTQNRKAYGIGDTDNPVTQLAFAMRYIRERYHGSPAEAHRFHNQNGWFDQGGWIMPGQTTVTNNTGHPELMIPHDQIPSFLGGGFNTGMVPPVRPLPRPPDVIAKRPQTPVTQTPRPAPVPQPTPPPVMPSAPPIATPPVQAPPTAGPAAPSQGPNAAPYGPSARSATGGGAGASSLDHNNPALSKGITSGFAAAGNAAAAAASFGMGGAGGGAMGGFISGLFGQAGKIANNIANVASSFLVGNITGGTTENPYGVTQRGSVPSGGTKVIDASNVQNGDIYTSNLDEYFKLTNRRDAQKAQSGLGRWGNA